MTDSMTDSTTDSTTAAGATANVAQASTGTDDTARAPGLAARSIAEGVGSFLVLLTGLGATMLATETALQPTLVFGFAVVAAMIAFGHVSGGHFNPAITVGSAVAGRTDWKAVVPYVAAQVLGAAAAAGLIWLALSANPQLTGIREFFSSSSNGFGEHSPVRFPLTSAFLLEVVATALLVAVFIGSGSRRARRDLAPFAVGLTYAGLLSFLLPVTNGGMNPVRATGSAIFAEAWALEQLWLFWAAPVIGALIAGLVFRSVDAWDTSRRDRAEGSAASVPAAGGSFLQEGTPVEGQVGGTTARPAGDAASFLDTPTPGAPGGSTGNGSAGTDGIAGTPGRTR